MWLEQYYTEEALTEAQRGQNILENSGLETENTGGNKWPGHQCNANEPNPCIKVSCNYNEDKGVQNESYRACLSYKSNVLEEMKVNFKLLNQTQVRSIILAQLCQCFWSGELFWLHHIQECTRNNKTRLYYRGEVLWTFVGKIQSSSFNIL